MEIKFKIKKLGPIVEGEIELKPFMLFSGKSGMGKSYTAFLVYAFYEILTSKDERQKYINQRSSADLVIRPKEEAFTVLYDQLETYFHLNVARIIGYLIGYKEVKCDVVLEIGDKQNVNLGDDDVLFEAQTGCAIDYLNKEIQSLYLLPPARGGFIDFPPSVFSKLGAGMYKEFISQLDELKSPTKDTLQDQAFLDVLLNDVFKGKIVLEQGSTKYSSGETLLPISAAASSIKELAPIFLLLKKKKPKDFFLLWEEPETHLHPILQRKVARLISYLINSGAQITITTHSDYLINQLNNLLKLFSIKQKIEDPDFIALLEKLGIDKQFILNPEMIGAYFFDENEKGEAVVKKQTIDTALPVDSFKTLVAEMMEETDTINDVLYE